MTGNGRTLSSRVFLSLVVAIAGLALAQPALAHEQLGVGGGLVRGLLHPEVEFRGMTPSRYWEADDPDTVEQARAHPDVANKSVGDVAAYQQIMSTSRRCTLR